MPRILITGASGLIGQRLTTMLFESGHEVVHLVRNPRAGKVKSFIWNIDREFIDPDAFDGVDAVVHLAGAGIADERWTDRRKAEILESRIRSSRLLATTLLRRAGTVKTFVAASAIGYYGFEDNERHFIESDPPGEDFLARVVRLWEREVDALQESPIRVVKVRVGIVLSKDGGALPAMAKPVRLYAGAALGSGKQHISWIHIDDICRIFQQAIENPSFSGAINGVGPGPVTNRELTRKIAKTLGRPLFLPAVPGIALKLVLGEMANLVLRGNYVSNQKLRDLNFQYRFNTVDEALTDLLT